MNTIKQALLFVCCMVSLVSSAQNTTSDYLSIEGATEMTINGTGVRFYVKLNGSINYSGYNMDIYLPDGLEFDLSGGNPRVFPLKTLWPYTEQETGDEDDNGDPIMEKSYTHSLTTEYKDPKHIKVICYSSKNESLTGVSGRLFYVYVKATSPYVSSNPKVTFSDISLTTSAEVEYDPEDCELEGLTVTNSRELPLTINSSNHWSTCILPFAAAIPAGVKAYTVGSHDSENLLLSEANSFTAYTPYILYSEGGYSGNVSGTVDSNQYPATGVVNTDGYLNGAIVAQNVTSGYVMQNLSEGVKFYQITSGTFNVPAGKCWMTLPAGGPVKGLGFVVEDESAIEQIKTPESHIIYNLAGQQVQNPQKGIYIVNGKKVMY